ncbi:hypothetical protein SAMN05216298_4934 [Glycomyces sambucus]|uniref:Uncharacterized protein n=1 Tax=Glycomyces sambucus TaxID=380244 RepID=A0A1G9MF86_9ACTN|nr:hypothetical protein [Glycomyces sambucus]SDL72794.1 hypothetical protein SAMN05216298_4934 [Glycomyces sambucus]
MDQPAPATSPHPSGPPRTSLARRLAPAIGLALLAPVCAEMLSGYDVTTGDPAALLVTVLFGSMLYGAPALLIRETARRAGLGWPGVLLLAAALGIVQAGIIDQSMFSANYRGIDYWAEMTGPTWIDPLGLSAFTALTFIGGHTLWSFTAPIAMVEAVDGREPRPWLRAPGLVVTAVLYPAAAYVVLQDHLANETDHASAAQVTGAAVTAAVLIVLALLLGRKRSRPVPRRVPPPAVLIPASAAALIAAGWTYTWTGVAVAAALILGGGAAIVHWSRSEHWDRRHATALAAGALLAVVLPSFLTDPIGETDPVAKYVNNAALTLLVIALAWWAMRRAARSAPPR